MEVIHVGRRLSPVTSAVAIILGVGSLAGCGSDNNDQVVAQAPSQASETTLACDDSIKTGFKPDANTTVLIVKPFKKGDPLLISGTPNERTPTASNDVCMVKLNVGPGNPGPATAPSTSPGIGIEIWLPNPANWNNRIRVKGGGGWAGGSEGSTTRIAGAGTNTESAAGVAMVEGAVSATTDTGHTNPANGGAFAMNPDGSINTTLWKDFSERGIHEMAVKTKALAKAYYGKEAKYSYWDGFSTGGRQGHKEAQANPADFDGILAGAPAFNWSKFITAELYPQIVFQRDLVDNGIAIPTMAQQDLVSNAAINACDSVGGQHLGYIPDPSQCTYDPAKDASVLCNGVAGGAGVIGTNTTPACVNLAQAQAINKIWYGMTANGSAPDPAVDNGWSQVKAVAGPGAGQRWFGPTRGTSLYSATFSAFGLNGPASPNGPFPIAPDQVALELQDPRLAEPSFVNTTANGQSNWKSLSYAQLSNAFDAGVSLQNLFSNINTDNPDLSGFKSRNGKMLMYHGLADDLIMPQGSINYYERVLKQMGGLSSVQSFYRFYLIPGMGHGFFNGSSNANATPPLPTLEQLYTALTNWVEKGTAPETITAMTTATATAPAKSRPLCLYPLQAVYRTGDPNVASSYACS